MGVVDKPDKDGEEDRGCVVEFVQEEDRVVEGFAEVPERGELQLGE